MSDEFTLPLGNKDIQYLPIMEQYARSVTLLCELEDPQVEGRLTNVPFDTVHG